MPTLSNLNELLQFDSDGPYVSIYQPTHRQHPDNKQDPILFRNLLKQVETALAANAPDDVVQSRMAPLQELASDTDFWNHTPDGIAVFSAAGFFRVMRLHRPTPSIAIVADSFHVKPLLRVVQSADRFHVLGISRQSVRLFEGNRDQLEETDLHPEVPRSAEDVTGDDLPEPVNRVRSVPGMGAGVATELRHGHGAKEEVVDQQTERFFRLLDAEIARYHTGPTNQPLILAGLPENQALFRSVSQNGRLVEAGIDANPDGLSVEELRVQAWRVMEPIYVQRLMGFVDQFHAARNVQRASADVSDVAASAVAGRVKVLLVEAERQVPGNIDLETGRVEMHDEASSVGDDLLDDIAEKVLRFGGEVVMVPPERMPADSGLAAIYRY